MSVRRFEFHDSTNNSHKFWEIHESNGCYHTEHGRIAGYGQASSRNVSKTKKCDGKEYRIIKSKINKGYQEVAPLKFEPSVAYGAKANTPVPQQQQQQQQQQAKTSSTLTSKNAGVLNWIGF